MKINPEMANFLIEPDGNFEKQSIAIIFTDYALDTGAFGLYLNDPTNTAVPKESTIRSWLTSNLGTDYSVCEFNTKSVGIESVANGSVLERTYDFPTDNIEMTYVRDGNISNFIMIVKEETAGTYNSSANISEVITGTVGKIGDPEEKDIMLKETNITNNTEIVKNTVKVNIQC